MKRENYERKLSKMEFLKLNIEDFEAVANCNYNIKDSIAYSRFIKNARETIGYSSKTIDYDIFNSFKRLYSRMIKGAKTTSAHVILKT